MWGRAPWPLGAFSSSGRAPQRRGDARREQRLRGSAPLPRLLLLPPGRSTTPRSRPPGAGSAARPGKPRGRGRATGVGLGYRLSSASEAEAAIRRRSAGRVAGVDDLSAGNPLLLGTCRVPQRLDPRTARRQVEPRRLLCSDVRSNSPDRLVHANPLTASRAKRRHLTDRSLHLQSLVRESTGVIGTRVRRAGADYGQRPGPLVGVGRLAPRAGVALLASMPRDGRPQAAVKTALARAHSAPAQPSAAGSARPSRAGL